MNDLDKLKIQIPEAQQELLSLILEDAIDTVKLMTGRTDISKYSAGVRGVAVILYNQIGREGQKSYSAGGVSVSYEELPQAVKHLLPKPLVAVGGRRFEDVASKP